MYTASGARVVAQTQPVAEDKSSRPAVAPPPPPIEGAKEALAGTLLAGALTAVGIAKKKYDAGQIPLEELELMGWICTL
jgi:hypothetical protein